VPSAQSADTATNATNATNATTASTANAAPISKVTYVSTTIPINTSGGPASGITATASSPTGTIVTGGGASVVDTTNGFVNDAYPTGKTGWAAVFFDNTGPTSGTVTAICAPAAATAP
jgi:hypothetical protein